MSDQDRTASYLLWDLSKVLRNDRGTVQTTACPLLGVIGAVGRFLNRLVPPEPDQIAEQHTTMVEAISRMADSFASILTADSSPSTRDLPVFLQDLCEALYGRNDFKTVEITLMGVLFAAHKFGSALSSKDVATLALEAEQFAQVLDAAGLALDPERFSEDSEPEPGPDEPPEDLGLDGDEPPNDGRPSRFTPPTPATGCAAQSTEPSSSETHLVVAVITDLPDELGEEPGDFDLPTD